MGKKRTFITQRSPSPAAPLGANATKRAKKKQKTVEEVELEEAVFGFAPELKEEEQKEAAEEGEGRKKKKKKKTKAKEAAGLGEMGHVPDKDLFIVDVPNAGESSAGPRTQAPQNEADEDEDLAVAKALAPSSSSALQRRSDRAPTAAWHDPTDSLVSVSLSSGPNRLKKLRDSAADDVVSGQEYEGKLRRQFERMHPEPAWVGQARKASRAEGAWDDEDGFERVLRSTGTRRGKKGGQLPSGEIEVTRLRDANQSDRSPGPISSIAFHPLDASILLTASATTRRLNLFRLQGDTHPRLHAVSVPEYPISNVAFEPTQGRTVFVGGNRPFFFCYDLAAQRCFKSSPRGLLGAGMGGSDAFDGSGGSFENFKFSPAGDMVAVAGRRGYVHLLDWGGRGAGSQVLASLKANASIKGLAWREGGKELLLLGEDTEVGVWDVGERRCVARWRDEGGYGPVGLETDRWDRWTAVGSKTGIVNVYDESAGGGGWGELEGGWIGRGEERKAMKAVENLTTVASTMRFNHDSQILALASHAKKDSLKLVHLPSATVFSNWPTSGSPLGRVTDVAFSRGSEHLAIGNMSGNVLLYSLGWWSKKTKGRSRGRPVEGGE